MNSPRAEQHRLALHLYARAMAIADPIRLRLWNEAELTTGQLRILAMLRAAPGSTLSQLAGELGVTPPTASGLIDRLARQEFVRREDDASDRRRVRHSLTDAGVAVVGEIEREASDLFDRLLAPLPDEELAAVIRGLTVLTGAAATLEQDPIAPAAAAEAGR